MLEASSMRLAADRRSGLVVLRPPLEVELKFVGQASCAAQLSSLPCAEHSRHQQDE